jgi:uncharacterized membrane protein
MLGGAGLAGVTIAIDRANDYQLVGETVVGTPADLQNILATTAASLVSLTSVVLSLTLVAVQLAMGQFSPRIVRAILTDRRSQLAIGLFLATFVHTLLTMREINDEGGTVPGFSALVTYALTFASVLGLVLFVNHAGQSIRVAGLIDLVGDETRAQLDRLYPDERDDAGGADDPNVIFSEAPGVVVNVHEDGLVGLARDAGCVLELVPAMGDFIPRGAPLMRIHGTMEESARKRALGWVILGPERIHEDDPAFGIRKLVDIAERTIASSPFDDPSSTVQALHRIHDCMRLLVRREFPSGRHTDDDGELRFVMPVLDWQGFARLAFDEVRQVGACSPQVARCLRAVLEDIKTVAPPDRQAPLDEQLALLDAAVERAFEDEHDVRAALIGDDQGIGSGADVMSRTDGFAGVRSS